MHAARSWPRWFLAPVWMALAMRASALILFGTDDPQRNTTAPTGDLAGSGWQWQNDSGQCSTAIGPRHAVTARHLGLAAGGEVRFGGLSYFATAVADAPQSDLRLIDFAGRLPAAAPVHTGTNEMGRTLVLHGRGTLRGPGVFADAPGGPGLRGWRWGAADGRLRWGTNTVWMAYTPKPEDGFTGEVLLAKFSKDGGDDQASFSGGDSGGGVFLKDDDDRWKLAGVIFAVEAEFRTTADGESFFAALFDRTGFYQTVKPNEWGLDPEAADRPETVLYITRVSAHADWLAGQMANPPAVAWPRLFSSTEVNGGYAEHPAYAVDVAKKTITLLTPEGAARFFALDGASVVGAPSLQDGRLVFIYE
jgi:hypothetical protein